MFIKWQGDFNMTLEQLQQQYEATTQELRWYINTRDDVLEEIDNIMSFVYPVEHEKVIESLYDLIQTSYDCQLAIDDLIIELDNINEEMGNL